MEAHFLKHLIQPTATHKTEVYFGIGFVGKDRVFGKFGFATVLYLWFADQMRQMLGAKTGKILLMDCTPPIGEKVDVSPQENTIKALLRLLQIDGDWELVKYSELFTGWPEGKTYPEVQTEITCTILSEGGYQIGWVYPNETPTTFDELFFAKFLQKNTTRTDIGFALGEFPEFIPAGIIGTPYLVKQGQEAHRLLLSETKESVRAKFVQQGKQIRVKRRKAEPALIVLRTMGALTSADENLEPTEQLIAGISRLAEILRQEV